MQQLRAYRKSSLDTVILVGLIAASSFIQVISGEGSPIISASAVTQTSLQICLTLLGISAATILLGVLWRGSNLTALEIELVGRATLILPAVAYGSAIIALAGVAGLLTAAMTLGLALSSIARAFFLYRRTRWLRRPDGVR